jgi:hypothetical protein
MTATDHKPAPLEDIPALDLSDLGITPWEPGTRPDGTREKMPPLYKDLLGLLGWPRRSAKR